MRRLCSGAAHHFHGIAAVALDFGNAGTVGVDFLDHLVSRADAVRHGAAVGVQAIRCHHVFVVHAQQATVGTAGIELAVIAQAEIVHAVMAITDTTLIGLGCFQALVAPGGIAKVQRIAQCVQDADFVAVGDRHQVGIGMRNRVEAQLQFLGWRGGRGGGGVVIVTTASRQTDAAQQHAGGGGHTAAQHAAAVQVGSQHVGKMGVAAVVDDFVIVVDDRGGLVLHEDSVRGLGAKKCVAGRSCPCQMTDR